LNAENTRKTKKHAQQRKRLGLNVRQQQANKKSLKKTANGNAKAVTAQTQKQGGIQSSLFQKLFGTKTAPQTAQQSIPYREMYKDGICRVSDKLFTKTISFDDINYQLAQNEDKTQIFEGYCC